MTLSSQNITDLQAMSRAGKSVYVAEYIKVTWDADDANQTRYYASTNYRELSGFGSIGFDIDARILNEPFKQFELYPDLRTDTISIIFDDIDRAITTLFQTYKSGVKIEFFQYYPQVNAHHSMWSGQLQSPQVWGWKQIETIATNGFRSREQVIPKRLSSELCPFLFGGLLTSDDLVTNGCKYDKHLGGSIGNFRTGSTPYLDCPRDSTACAARGMTSYFGGIDTDAAPVLTDGHSGYMAVSKGNASNLRNPHRVIFGTKTVRAMPVLVWRREMNAHDQDKGFVACILEVGEGPIKSIRNIKLGEKLIEFEHIATRLGTAAQPALTQYAPDISNFSYLATIFARKGWVDPLQENVQTLSANECVVAGFKEVTTFTPTVSRIWTNNRAWCLLELMTNVRFGMAYPISRFNVDSWSDCAAWTGKSVTFAYTNADSETRSFAHTRSSFDCVVEGRPVAENIVDICRSGRLSVPFQKDGEFHIEPFRAFTDAELSAAITFTDTGSSRNILWNDGIPQITPTKIPDDKIINEIVVFFEDGANKDKERPITVNNPNQQLLAGRTLGEDNRQSVPTRIAGFGIRNLNEAVKLGYGLLRFGPFDEGGILNNLAVQMEVPLVEALSVERYGVIKIVSSRLNGFTLPDNDLLNSFTAVQYFRVLQIIKTSKDTALIKAQAYNETAYNNFETVSGETQGDPPVWPPTTPSTPTPDPTPTPRPIPCAPELTSIDYSPTDRKMLIDIIC